MKKVMLFGKEYELAYTIASMTRIEKRCGDIDKLSAWMDEGTNLEKFTKICQIIGDMINGAIQKHNSEIAVGLASGEKAEFLSDDFINALPDVLSVEEIVAMQSALIDTMNGAEEVDIPDNSDPDLADVESVKKN